MKKDDLDRVGDVLRKEGRDEAAEFSPELHGRIMERLRARGLERMADGAGSRRAAVLGRVGVGLAVAAAVALAAWLWMEPSGTVSPGPSRETVQTDVLPKELMPPVREVLVEKPTSAWEEARYGYLDKDAQKLALFVAEQLPGFGTEGAREKQ